MIFWDIFMELNEIHFTKTIIAMEFVGQTCKRDLKSIALTLHLYTYEIERKMFNEICKHNRMFK